jgi:Outer membrane protein beta-barrel domain
MNSIFKIHLAALTLCVAAIHQSEAQFTPSKWEIGLNLGTLIYQGDLSTGNLGYTYNLKPAIGVWAAKSIDDYFSIRYSLLRGELGADESVYSTPDWKRHRNFRFNTSVTEFSTSIVWDLFGKTYKEGMKRFSPYFFAGAGFSILNVNRDWSRFDTSYFNSKSSASIGLGIDSTHKTPWIIPVIPVGAGLRYMISNHFFLNAEASYRITWSDEIDGFKYSGNPQRNDHYYGLSVGLSYRFGSNRTDCPKM